MEDSTNNVANFIEAEAEKLAQKIMELLKSDMQEYPSMGLAEPLFLAIHALALKKAQTTVEAARTQAHLLNGKARRN